jgi:hypothetical protein
VERFLLLFLAATSLPFAASWVVARHADAPVQIPVEQANPVRIAYPAAMQAEISLPGGRHERIRSLLSVDRRMHYGDFVWNEDGIPPGPAWVRVDLAAQTISAFRAGHEIGTAVILYGTDGYPTPTGAFRVIEKDKDHWSRSYDAPMSYMLRLTDDGVAIHASDVEKGFATHGCVGVPLAFARHLFAAMNRGDPVVILPIRGGQAAEKEPQSDNGNS